MGCGASTTAPSEVASQTVPSSGRVAPAPFYGVVHGERAQDFTHFSGSTREERVTTGQTATPRVAQSPSSPYRPGSTDPVDEKSFNRAGWRSSRSGEPLSTLDNSMIDAHLPTTSDSRLGLDSSREVAFLPEPSPSPVTTTTPDYNPATTTTDDTSSDDGYVRKVMKSHTEPQLDDFLRPPLDSSTLEAPVEAVETRPALLPESQSSGCVLVGSVNEIAPLLRQTELLEATTRTRRTTFDPSPSSSSPVVDHRPRSTQVLPSTTIDSLPSERLFVNQSVHPATASSEQNPQQRALESDMLVIRASFFEGRTPLESATFYYRRPDAESPAAARKTHSQSTSSSTSPTESYLWKDITEHPDRRRSSGFSAIEPTDPGWWVPYATTHLKTSP